MIYGVSQGTNSLRSLNHPDWIANDGRRRACMRYVRLYFQQENYHREFTCDQPCKHRFQSTKAFACGPRTKDCFPRTFIEIIIHANPVNGDQSPVLRPYPFVIAMPKRLEFRPLYRPRTPSRLMMSMIAW